MLLCIDMYKPKETKTKSATPDSCHDIASMRLRIEGGIQPMQEKIAKVQALLVHALESQKVTPATKEMSELIEDGIGTHKKTIEMMMEFEAGLQKETVRLKEAELALETNDIESLKESFRSFIINDASISHKTIMMNFYEFDEIIRSIERFNGLSPDDNLN